MISIIIPTLNEISVIEKTLKHFRMCTKHRLEIIVSDGGSSDGTVEVARKYADKVIIYSGTKRQTIAMGRNSGALEARGEILAFFDADITVPEPDIFFEKINELFLNNRDIVACTVGLKVLQEQATWSDRFFFTLINYAYFIQNNILKMGAASGECQIVKRSVFEKLAGYREDLAVAEDQEFFRRLSRVGKTFFIRGFYVYHSGRRAHKIGWPKLLFLWIANGIFVPLFGRSFSKVWKEIR